MFVCFVATMVQVNKHVLRKWSHFIDRRRRERKLHNFFSLIFR
jgi:hypothetical protein